MKQKTSFFNWGLCRNILARTWPLWICYLAVLLITIPGNLPSADMRHYSDTFLYKVDFNYVVLQRGIDAAQISVIAGVIAAMLVFSFMYSSRTCGMINALPMRRETAFCTAYITGLAPLLLADIIAVLATLAAAPAGMLDVQNLWTLLAFAAMGSFAFFSFAAFCAVLTGNVIVLSAVYVVLGCTVYVVAAAVSELLTNIIYGFPSSYINTLCDDILYALSPIVAVMSPRLYITRDVSFDAKGVESYTGSFTVKGLELMAGYCAAALILVVCAVLIYKRRDMERAGDVVAVPVLRPIFKYCMTFGAALVFAVVIYSNYISRPSSGFAAALICLGLLLAGAFIGYFVSEMLMQKTLRVFKGRWTGFVVSCVILSAGLFAAELDVFNYERNVPAPEEVTHVRLSTWGEVIELDEEENIAAVTRAHGGIVADKRQNEAAYSTRRVTIDYTLADGGLVSRVYRVSYDPEAVIDEASNIRALDAIYATDEARAYSLRFNGKEYQVNDRVIDFAELSGYYVDEDGSYINLNRELSDAEAAELYNQCLLPDSRDSSLGWEHVIYDEEYYDSVSNISFYITLKTKEEAVGADGMAYQYTASLSLSIPLDAARTMKWLEENTELRVMSLQEADPVGTGESLASLVRTRSVAPPSTQASVGIIGGADGPTAVYVSG